MQWTQWMYIWWRSHLRPPQFKFQTSTFISSSSCDRKWMTRHTFNNSWDNFWTSYSTRWWQLLQENSAQLADTYFSHPTTPMVDRAQARTWTSSPTLMFLFWFSQLCKELKFSIKHSKTVGHGHCSFDHYDLFCQLDNLTVMSKQLQLHLIFDSHLSWFPSYGRTGCRLLIL